MPKQQRYNLNRPTPLSVAAYYWLEHIYQPTMEILDPLPDRQIAPAELYCQVLENKWYLSEKARHDVGHPAAARDYLERFGSTQTLQSG